MRESTKKGKRSRLAKTAKLDLFFPLFPGCSSHPIHNPLTFISECKDTTKNLNLQEKTRKKVSKLQLCYYFYIFATNATITGNTHHYTKNLCDY